MPKLWSETIETHRQEVRDAIVETTAALVAEHGLRSVTMSQIAEDTGIGRATLYKYFSDVEAILVAWHQTHVSNHLDQLIALGDGSGDAFERLSAVLDAYALICFEIAHQNHGADLTALVHRGQHIDETQRHLSHFVGDLLSQGADQGLVRSDVSPEELATYCLNALAAASSMASKAAVHRLVSVTLTGLRSLSGKESRG